jgi:hypothetical protein
VLIEPDQAMHRRAERKCLDLLAALRSNVSDGLDDGAANLPGVLLSVPGAGFAQGIADRMRSHYAATDVICHGLRACGANIDAYDDRT